jgi:ATP-binding cassette subfamily B protein
MQSAMASSERIFLLLDSRERISEPEMPSELPDVTDGTAVSFNKVWFSYTGTDWVLKDVSFTARRGETVAVVGPTGAGKSTLIHLIERFYDPTQGSICMSGVDIRQIPKTQLRAGMALITQDVFLFADTIRETSQRETPISVLNVWKKLSPAVILTG